MTEGYREGWEDRHFLLPEEMTATKYPPFDIEATINELKRRKAPIDFEKLRRELERAQQSGDYYER